MTSRVQIASLGLLLFLSAFASWHYVQTLNQQDRNGSLIQSEQASDQVTVGITGVRYEDTVPIIDYRIDSRNPEAEGFVALINTESDVLIGGKAEYLQGTYEFRIDDFTSEKLTGTYMLRIYTLSDVVLAESAPFELKSDI